MPKNVDKKRLMLELYKELQQVEKEQSEGAKWYTVEELDEELEKILNKSEHEQNMNI